MNDVLIQLLPVIVGATLVPLYFIVVLLLLLSQGGLRRAIAIVFGAVAVRLAQGVLFGLVFGAAAEAFPDDGPAIIASTLLLVVGILLLIAAFTKWRKQPDPDEPPPQWMAAIGGLSTLQAAGAGAFIIAISVKQWVYTLTAIDVIQGSALDTAAAAAAYLLYTLATQALVLLPILVYTVAPRQSAKPMQEAHAWLELNSRAIVIAVSLVFGIYFSYKGVSGLMG